MVVEHLLWRLSCVASSRRACPQVLMVVLGAFDSAWVEAAKNALKDAAVERGDGC